MMGFLLDVYTVGLKHSLRRSWIQATGKIMIKAESRVWDQTFRARIVPTGPSTGTEQQYLRILDACVEGPANSVVSIEFMRHLANHAEAYCATLARLLSMWRQRDDSESLLIARLLQAVGNGLEDFPTEYRDTLVSLLSEHHGETLRDLTTQVGYLLCLHFPAERFDRPDWNPLPRMSVRRGAVNMSSVIDFGEVVGFYASFVHDGTGMELHYALQSIQLLLIRVFQQSSTKARSTVPTLVLADGSMRLNKQDGMDITEMCLLRWDHTWQMVASSCRSLFGLVCQVADAHLLEALIARAGSLELGSKKRFNYLFGLAPYVDLLAVHGLIAEILAFTRTSSPSVSSACQLLQGLMEKEATNPDRLRRILDVIVDHLLSADADNLDIEQLFSALAKASRSGDASTADSPLAVLVKMVMASPSPPQLLLLRLLQYGMSAGGGKLVQVTRENGDKACLSIAGRSVFTLKDFAGFMRSADSSIVTAALVVVLRIPPPRPKLSGGTNDCWFDLVGGFVIGGGLITAGCCNDDRSVVVHEMKRFLEKNSSTLDQKGLFKNLWCEATRLGGLLEESQLAVEIVTGLSTGRIKDLAGSPEEYGEFVETLLLNGLTSRWRKIRLPCRSFFSLRMTDRLSRANLDLVKRVLTRLMERSIECNDELAGSVLDALAMTDGEAQLRKFATVHIITCDIIDPNIPALTCVAHADPMTVRTVTAPNADLIPYLLAVLVYHSQFIGDNCVDALLGLTGDLLTPFTAALTAVRFAGAVDCRGHPIMANDEESTALSIKSWSATKAAALCLAATITANPDIAPSSVAATAQVLALLLLSVKHPAAIAPLESAFAAVLCRLSRQSVEGDLLQPLIATVTDAQDSPTFTLPAALRRSQGLGPLLCAIVKSQSNLACMGAVVERLLAIVNTSKDESESNLHALNILRWIVRDSSISEQLIEPFIGDILSASIDILARLSVEFWRVRSCATQLFVQAARRLLGTDSEEDWIQSGRKAGSMKSRKTVTAKDFFFNRTKGSSSLLTEIIAVMDKGEFVIVPILSVLQSLSDLAAGSEGSGLIDRVREGMSNPSAHVRRLSCKVVARMVTEAGVRDEVSSVWSDLAVKGNDWNGLHGRLLLANNLARLVPSRDIPTDLVIPQLKTIWAMGAIPELIGNAVMSLWIKMEVFDFLVSDPRVANFVSTLDEADVMGCGNTARLVVNFCHGPPDHPVYRDWLVSIINTHPGLVPVSTLHQYREAWMASKYIPGIAALIEPLAESRTALTEWIGAHVDVNDENLPDTVKIVLAQSEAFRSAFPDMHLSLLMDESAEVRAAASVDGLNAYASFDQVVRKCSTSFLVRLLAEPFTAVATSVQLHDSLFTHEQGGDFRLYRRAREIAAIVLKTRQVGTGPTVNIPVDAMTKFLSTTTGEANHATRSKLDSIRHLAMAGFVTLKVEVSTPGSPPTWTCVLASR